MVRLLLLLSLMSGSLFGDEGDPRPSLESVRSYRTDSSERSVFSQPDNEDGVYYATRSDNPRSKVHALLKTADKHETKLADTFVECELYKEELAEKETQLKRAHEILMRADKHYWEAENSLKSKSFFEFSKKKELTAEVEKWRAARKEALVEIDRLKKEKKWVSSALPLTADRCSRIADKAAGHRMQAVYHMEDSLDNCDGQFKDRDIEKQIKDVLQLVEVKNIVKPHSHHAKQTEDLTEFYKTQMEAKRVKYEPSLPMYSPP